MPSTPKHRVSISVDRAYGEHVRPRKLTACVRRALLAERVGKPRIVTVVITSDATVRRLNRRFLGQDRPTDVLSFGLDSGASFVAGQGAAHLGEIVVSFPTARRQARDAGHDVEDELEHLLVHGTLHLLGYDHEGARDERVMRAREEAVLGRPVH